MEEQSGAGEGQARGIEGEEGEGMEVQSMGGEWRAGLPTPIGDCRGGKGMDKGKKGSRSWGVQALLFPLYVLLHRRSGTAYIRSSSVRN